MSAKVFVGNLVFSTTDEQLKEAFAGSANVVTANMITRGRRSLGYGFVEFATEEDAVKAVEAMNKKEVDGRPINVELARPRDTEKEEEAAQKKAARVAKPRAPRTPKESTGAASSNGQVATSSSVEGGASPAAGGRGRRGAKRTGAARRGGTKSNGDAAAGANGASPAATTAAPRCQRTNNNNHSSSAEDRALSETTLFVANVPFSSDDDQLKSYFAEHNPKAAHIVRMRNGRSRGYGFVEFDTLEGQKAGLTVDGKEVPIQSGGNLKLSVKVAMANRAPSETGAASFDAPAASETPK